MPSLLIEVLQSECFDMYLPFSREGPVGFVITSAEYPCTKKSAPGPQRHGPFDKAAKPRGRNTSEHATDAKDVAVQPTVRTHVDVKETAEMFQFIADLPGVDRADVKLAVEHPRTLVISGKRKVVELNKGDKYLRVERNSGTFLRKFTLLELADLESVIATYEYGILTPHIQNLTPPKPKRLGVIEVQAN